MEVQDLVQLVSSYSEGSHMNIYVTNASIYMDVYLPGDNVL